MKDKKIHRIIIFSSIILTAICMISCGSTPKASKNKIPEPQWITDKKGSFPDSEFLAQLGTGASAAEAQNNSIAQLASYFNTNVKSIVQGDSTIYNGPDNASWVERQVKTSVVTTTDLELFALETTEPYYLDRESKWYCCAFIERKAAWNLYEPLVQDKKNDFFTLYKLAQTETEPLQKIRAYSQAQPLAEAFISSLFRASMFSKTMTEQAFSKDRDTAASIPALIQAEKNKCIFYITADQDFGGIISSALNKCFTQMGFITSDSSSKAMYLVQSDVNYNAIEQDELLVYYPSIKISVASNEKTIYVYENTLEKILSYNEAKAKNTACTKFAELLDTQFSDDFYLSVGLSE